MFSNKAKNLNLLVVGFLIFLAVLARFLPHPPNFTPIAAIALFAGFYLPRKWALFLPVSAMLISDIFIGFYTWQVMAVVYISFILTVLLGGAVKRLKQAKWQKVGFGAVSGALLFFALTNLAVFLFTPLYAKTFAGFLQCYLMALPFFKNTLLGNLFYAASFFSIYELVSLGIKRKMPALCRLRASKNYL